MALKITGRMKVKTLKSMFKNEFGLSLRVYDGITFANDDDTIAKIRKKEVKGGELSIARNMKVGNVEKKIEEMFGIKVQISGSDDSYLCNNDLTLAQALEYDKKLMEKRKKGGRSNKIQQKKDENEVKIEDVIEEIKKIYSNHKELNRIIENLNSDFRSSYLGYWGREFCNPDFPANLDLARKLFKLNEKDCGSTWEFVSLAKNVLSGLKDREWATSLYKKALEVENGSSDILDVAKGILSDLGDRNWAISVFKKAIEKKEGFSYTINIADSILTNLNDKEWAKKLYEESYKQANDLCDYVSLIHSISRYLKDKEWAVRIVKEIVNKLNKEDENNLFEFADPSCVLELGEFIATEDGMNDKELAKKIFNMNKSCDSITDLLDSARKVKEIYEDSEYTKQYVEDVLNRAIELVDEGYYCDIYYFIKDELQDEKKAEEFKKEYYYQMKEDYEDLGSCEEIFGNNVDIDDIDFDSYVDTISLVGIETKFIFDEIEEMMDENGKLSEEGIELANEKLEEFIDELKDKLNGVMDDNSIKALVSDEVIYYKKGALIDSVDNIRGIYFLVNKKIPTDIMNAIFLSINFGYFIALFKDHDSGEVVMQSYYDGEYDSGYFSEGMDDSYIITDDKLNSNEFYKWYRKIEEEIID